MEELVHHHFTALDWIVVFAYLGLTTYIGHLMRGKQASIRDFFLGGRSLPWPAVTGSIIATEISALTFIGVPGTVFAVHGDFTYLQWALGSVIARFAVGYWLVPLYYQKEIYSPYDFIGNRLGVSAKQLVTGLFTLGGVLGQSVRVVVTAIILTVVTDMPINACIVIIGLFAVVWTWMGGMRTVIWTDVVQFFIFVGGGLLALFWLIGSIDGGWKTITETSQNAQVAQFTWKSDMPEFRTVYQVQADGGVREQIAVEQDPLTQRPNLVAVRTGESEFTIPVQYLPAEKVVRFEWKGQTVERELSASLADLPQEIPLETNAKGETLVTATFVMVEGELRLRVNESQFQAVMKPKNKMNLLDLRFRDPDTGALLSYTLWIALLAMPFQNFAAFGMDQLNAQRIFCCRSAVDARKAIVWSSVSIFITVLMLMVSAGLYTWYQKHPITEQEFNLFVQDANYVFPVWITTVIPPGLTGLLIAAAFAAAISSLDSILAALSQTTLSSVLGRDRFEHDQGTRKMVWYSRLTVIGWGIVLCLVAILLNALYQKGEKDLINFAFRMLAYTYGPMLGILVLAIFPIPKSTRGILVGALLSIFLVAIMLPDLYSLLANFGIQVTRPRIFREVPFPWFFPLNAGITILCGWLGGIIARRFQKPEVSG